MINFFQATAEKLELNLDDFIETKKNALEQLEAKAVAEVKLEGIGFFTLENNKLHFKASNVNPEFWNNSFGLAPLTNFTPDNSDSKSDQPRPNKKFLPWLIGIASVILLGGGGWLFYFNYYKSTPPPSPAPLISQPKDSVIVELKDSAVAQVVDTVEKKEFEKPPPPKPNPPKKQVIDKRTQKYYFIVGSYLTLDNAQLALKDYLKKGHENGNIIVANGKYRVAIGGGFADKNSSSKPTVKNLKNGRLDFTSLNPKIIPELTIIISYYKSLENLRLILKALQNQSSQAFEVIVSEDDNNLETSNYIDNIKSSFNFAVLHLNQKVDDGFKKAAMLNKSILTSNTEKIVFIDGDCIPHKDFVKQYIKAIDRQNFCVGRAVLLDKKTTEAVKTTQNLKLLNFFNLLFSKTSKLKDGIYFPFFHLTLKTKGLLGRNWGCHKKLY